MEVRILTTIKEALEMVNPLVVLTLMTKIKMGESSAITDF